MNQGLAASDWLVVVLYFGLVALVALAAARGSRTTKDYFLAGRSLPWWAAALSIVATETSAVTFIGVPRYAYQGNWSFLQLVLGFVMGRLFLAFFMVHVFYRREFITVYGYLAERFGPWTRTLAALFFLAGRVIASGVRLFAGCVALQVAAGLSSNALVIAILALGAFGTLFTMVGGIRTVVWTDVLLGLTFIAGAVVSVAFLLTSIPGGWPALLANPELPQKMQVLDLDFSLGNAWSLLAGLAGGFFLTLATHGTDQDIAQRMLTCRDSKNGSLSVIGSAVIILPLIAIFLAIGTLLHFFYNGRPPTYPQPADLNHIFPVFIVRELPHGFSGFVMAGLLAVSLSSLMSVLNALSSSTISDFYEPLRQRISGLSSDASEEHHLFKASRAVTLLWGGALILMALAFQGSKKNVLEIALQTLTYFYGALLGTFLLGIFTRRGNALSVSAGMCLSVPAVLLLQLRQFLADRSAAPESVNWLIERLPETFSRLVIEKVPDIAWPYWIIAGTAISFGVGALGSKPRGAADLSL